MISIDFLGGGGGIKNDVNNSIVLLIIYFDLGCIMFQIKTLGFPIKEFQKLIFGEKKIRHTNITYYSFVLKKPRLFIMYTSILQ